MGAPLDLDEQAKLAESTSYEDYVARGGTASRALCGSRRYQLKQRGIPIQEWPRGAEAIRGAVILRPETVQEMGMSHEEEPLGFREREEDEDLRSYWEAQKRAMEAHQRRSAKLGQRVLFWESPDPPLPVGICFFGDTHIGSMGVLGQRLEDDIATMAAAADDLDLRFVFMGDLVDNYKPAGKARSGMFGQAISNPMDQLDVARLLLAPLAGRFLAFLAGNHDDGWDAQASGIMRIPEIAKEMDAPYVSEAGCALKLTVGFQRYTIYAKHDWRGKATINKSNALRRFWQEYPEWENADVGVLAHTHEPLLEQTQQKGTRVTWIRTGTWKVHDSYAAQHGFTPEMGVGVVILDPFERRITSSLDLDEGITLLRTARERAAQRDGAQLVAGGSPST